MPYNRPDLPTLLARIRADIAQAFPGADATLRRSVFGALAAALAGLAHGLHGRLDWEALQLMPDTAESDRLDRWASIWGVTRKPPAAAAGLVDCTGDDGVLIPAGTLFQRSDGIQFLSEADAIISGGVASVSVSAVDPGLAGNTDALAHLTLVSPIAGVDSQALVAAGGLGGGADTETDDALRARLLARIQEPPHGGASFDYVSWALEVSGVTRAWCYPLELGPGTVSVRFMMDDAYADGIPQPADVDAVQAHIDAVRPVTASVTVAAPVAVPLDFTIRLVPNDAATQAAVQAELKDLIRREAEPGGTLLLSHIQEAISIAAGETDHTLVTPTADVTHNTGEIATMGTITWQ
ncbi:MAG: baseplate J/gp47 family protein [Gammaproteobacteria bacterium]|nr:MAG: baseplate J/gp47 family protein [Gammaproteobacteria bacterium]